MLRIHFFSPSIIPVFWGTLFCAILSAANAPACSHSSVQYFSGKTVTETMTVASATACETRLRTAPGGIIGAREIDIIEAPAHGQATIIGPGAWSYQSNANYRGTDSFTVSILFGDNSNPRAWVKVEVTVVAPAGSEKKQNDYVVVQAGTVHTEPNTLSRIVEHLVVGQRVMVIDQVMVYSQPPEAWYFISEADGAPLGYVLSNELAKAP